MANVTHEQVRHRQFGVGTVTEQTETTVTVMFNGAFGLRKFQYPLAFDAYLELCRPDAKQAMDTELQQFREQTTAEQKRRIEDLDRRREEKRRAT